ncbi:SUMO1 sentrin specific peptidase 8 [Coemansia thaxteri]|nr:SUMO1 sentrin specific peptidase 8 [Coemansia thaxteri]KAJ2471822.1 SUMO1 sentrin specific peptidase 8 [Coemansia sp. RSA 2322]
MTTNESSAPPNIHCHRLGITLSSTDIDALKPGEWVTDDVIDFYFKYLKRKYFPASRKYVYIPVNLANLLTERALDNSLDHLAELASDANALDFKTQCLARPKQIRVAFIPIFGDGHWSLLVYKSQKPKLPEFLHFNSYLNSTREHHTQCARTALINLLYVFRQNDPSMVISKESYKLVVKNCPQQNNGNDCGIFVAMYAYVLSARLSKREAHSRASSMQDIIKRISNLSFNCPSPTPPASHRHNGNQRQRQDELSYSSKNPTKDSSSAIVGDSRDENAWKVKDKDVIPPDDMRSRIINTIHHEAAATSRSVASL